jgi:excisionase family DNA binding protein
MENLYDISSAAQKLGGISEWTIRSWLTKGLLRRTKVGRRTMISEAEIERFVREQNLDVSK